jgi:predicted lysophospholipase L1 biosynthesis ABC-type transport system permease subunit
MGQPTRHRCEGGAMTLRVAHRIGFEPSRQALERARLSRVMLSLAALSYTGLSLTPAG